VVEDDKDKPRARTFISLRTGMHRTLSDMDAKGMQRRAALSARAARAPKPTLPKMPWEDKDEDPQT
jgi:hypothetical protein